MPTNKIGRGSWHRSSNEIKMVKVKQPIYVIARWWTGKCVSSEDELAVLTVVNPCHALWVLYVKIKDI